MYAKIENGSVVEYPYGLAQLQRDNSNTSFVVPVTPEVYAEYGVLPVAATEQPVVDHTKRIVEGTPFLVDGAWAQTWVVEDISSEELQQRTEAQARAVRQQRDEKLKALDWTQGKDIPDSVSGPAAVTRQALRDVPAQAGFPWEVVWPDA